MDGKGVRDWPLGPLCGSFEGPPRHPVRFARRRYATIGRALDAQKFDILVGTRIGQMRMKESLDTKKLIESKGRESAVFALANFDPSFVEIYAADAFVCTACSRIAIDDALTYKKPMLTPPELEVELGILKWEDYAFDQFYG